MKLEVTHRVIISHDELLEMLQAAVNEEFRYSDNIRTYQRDILAIERVPEGLRLTLGEKPTEPEPVVVPHPTDADPLVEPSSLV